MTQDRTGKYGYSHIGEVIKTGLQNQNYVFVRGKEPSGDNIHIFQGSTIFTNIYTLLKKAPNKVGTNLASWNDPIYMVSS